MRPVGIQGPLSITFTLAVGSFLFACSSSSTATFGRSPDSGASGDGGKSSVGGASGGQGAGGTNSGSGGTKSGSGGGNSSSGGSNTSSGGGGGVGGTMGTGGTSGGWLSTKGNKIVTADGKPFHGRGANLHDTRSCNACTAGDPNPAGLNKWADELIDGWHANFIRFDLESYPDNAGYRKHWKGILDDPGYYADIQNVVHHMTSKPGVYVMVTVFIDPTMVDNGGGPHSEWPTDATMPIYQKLAEAFYNDPGVLFGLTNEPHDPASSNSDLALVFSKAIQTIRDVEKAHGTPSHIVVAQASQGYARDLSYWVSNPLTVEGGKNIAYEVHPYNHLAEFDALFVQPSKKIPVLIGEFGPADTYMSLDDAKALMGVAETNEVPYIGWNFHQRCPPNMLQDMGASGYDGCGFVGAGTTYTWPPTEWGQALKDHLATPW
jgi:Cellulase (glycosyl hydrolase family 5)